MKSYKYLAMLSFLSTISCMNSDSNYYEDRETRLKAEDQKKIQRDMRHNRCISRGHTIGSPEYNHCIKVKY